MPTPVLFSKYFSVDPSAFDKAGLLDPFLEHDVRLFIDPLLIEKSSNDVLRNDGFEQFHQHFENLIRLLAICEKENDPAWVAAEKILSLKEPPENGLGFSRSGRAGTSRPRKIRKKLLGTIKSIVRLGSKDPQMLSLMSFLEEDIGPDTISDFTTRAMSSALSKITNSFCRENGIDVFDNSVSDIQLPIYKSVDGKEKAMLLIPKDVLRHLPITDSWSDVWAATEFNKELRDKVSQMLGGIAAPTIVQQKKAIRAAVLQSASIFDQFLAVVRDSAVAYDQNEDVFAYYKIRDLMISNEDLGRRINYDLKQGADEVHRIVLDAVSVFQHHVENGNLWEALWTSDKKPKRERAAQLIFFAVADAHCRMNNVGVVSEPNFGGGPVDFSFSHKFDARVLVEMKRSSGTVEHGYEKQLEFYKKAARSEYGIFVVIDYGDAGTKISNIKKMRNERLQAGERASEIIVIDAKQKASASKRS